MFAYTFNFSGIGAFLIVYLHLFIEQVREAIGVTLSVLCSNLRLYASCCNGQLHEGRDIDDVGCWDQYLVKRASELVPKIQSVSASETLEIPTEEISENGASSDHSKDDIRWMETVSFCPFHFCL